MGRQERGDQTRDLRAHSRHPPRPRVQSLPTRRVQGGQTPSRTVPLCPVPRDGEGRDPRPNPARSTSCAKPRLARRFGSAVFASRGTARKRRNQTRIPRRTPPRRSWWPRRRANSHRSRARPRSRAHPREKAADDDRRPSASLATSSCGVEIPSCFASARDADPSTSTPGGEWAHLLLPTEVPGAEGLDATSAYSRRSDTPSSSIAVERGVRVGRRRRRTVRTGPRRRRTRHALAHSARVYPPTTRRRWRTRERRGDERRGETVAPRDAGEMERPEVRCGGARSVLKDADGRMHAWGDGWRGVASVDREWSPASAPAHCPRVTFVACAARIHPSRDVAEDGGVWTWARARSERWDTASTRDERRRRRRDASRDCRAGERSRYRAECGTGGGGVASSDASVVLRPRGMFVDVGRRGWRETRPRRRRGVRGRADDGGGDARGCGGFRRVVRAVAHAGARRRTGGVGVRIGREGERRGVDDADARGVSRANSPPGERRRARGGDGGERRGAVHVGCRSKRRARTPAGRRSTSRRRDACGDDSTAASSSTRRARATAVVVSPRIMTRREKRRRQRRRCDSNRRGGSGRSWQSRER